MANLAAHQKVDRVIFGSPWGDGANGSATVSSDPNTRASITGTATQTTGTAGSTAFANGDLVLLHQTQGTGVGQWEINKVASGGGSTSLTFQVAHNYTFGTGAQIIKVPRYTTATISAHSVPQWDGTTGSVEVILARTSITVSGALNGGGKGFRRGPINGSSGNTQGGEGGAGNGNTTYGAGGVVSGCGGPGGGYGANGSAAGSGGTAGQAYGSADLTVISMGGSGGGASGNGDGLSEGYGGSSGAVIILISKEITLSAGVSVNGENGYSATDRGGGGGSGGAALVICDTASLGTNQITSAAGSKGTGTDANANGGDGGVGRIAVHHKGTVTGTTNPTFSDTTDSSLVEIVSGGSFLFNFI